MGTIEALVNSRDRSLAFGLDLNSGISSVTLVLLGKDHSETVVKRGYCGITQEELYSTIDVHIHRLKMIFEASSELVVDAILHSRKFPMYQTLLQEVHNGLEKFNDWKINHIAINGNKPALELASSVTRERYQSYITKGEPECLAPMLSED
ncbi:unnamed protein product [Arabis nemorensis]|uniref:RNase H type-1 domain-containing protein n=1 Tax=Arabis nemorensis TaxID=586526 RepID=A0A565BK99_9BRAS|nr:unnamed protein product [Arabis nemorensis]